MGGNDILRWFYYSCFHLFYSEFSDRSFLCAPLSFSMRPFFLFLLEFISLLYLFMYSLPTVVPVRFNTFCGNIVLLSARCFCVQGYLMRSLWPTRSLYRLRSAFLSSQYSVLPICLARTSGKSTTWHRGSTSSTTTSTQAHYCSFCEAGCPCFCRDWLVPCGDWEISMLWAFLS